MAVQPNENKQRCFIDRFESKFIKKGLNECWLWMGCKNDKGYGQFRTDRTIYSHRLSYQLYVGNIPKGLYVLHTCDKPLCCNPQHLFLGTQKANMKDMHKKGRSIYDRGQLHPRAKLTAQEVLEIRDLYKSGLFKNKDLSDNYGIHVDHMLRIINGKYWNQQ